MAIYRACLTFLKSVNLQSLTLNRHFRNAAARRRGGPRLLKGKVKSNDGFEEEDFSRISSYQDVMKMAGPDEQLLVEKALTSENDFGASLMEDGVSEFNFRDDKSLVKKKIIIHKHFNIDLVETNLMTCAAKEQVRYLHKLNPNVWTPEALSEHFPVTERGVKKLLKSYFIHQHPERIKKHDDEVEEKWKALESGEASELITPYTRRLWNEGKLNKINYKSNPNLPSIPTEKGKTVILNKPKIGQYSAIVQQYVNYKTKMESKVKLSDGKEVQLQEEVKKKPKIKNKFQFTDYNYRAQYENSNPERITSSNRIKLSKRIDSFEDLDIVHGQYTTNLKEEQSLKDISSDQQYAEWVDKQTMHKEPQKIGKKCDEEVFIKIPKFKETENFRNAMFTEEMKKPSFQHKNVKQRHHNKTSISSRNKNTIYREGQNVYDEHGQFLYKVPFKI